MDRTLIGGHVQRVVALQPRPRPQGGEVVLLRVRVPGATVHVVVAGGRGAGTGVGVVSGDASERLREAMRGTSAPSQARWRARVEGGRIVGVGPRAIAVALPPDGKVWRVAAEPGGEVGLDPAEGGEGEHAPRGQVAGDEGAIEELEARGARIAEELGQESTGARGDELRRALAKAVARVERRAEAIRGDLARAGTADEMAASAQLFVTAAAQAPRGATRLVAVDWSSGEAREVQWQLDPARGAREQIDALFQRARRLKDGARIARARLDDADHALAALRAVAATLAAGAADAPLDFDALEAAARAAAPRDFKLASGSGGASGAAGTARAPRKRGKAQPPLPPYRVFASASANSAHILVGRGAEKNDALTFHVARPHDLWLHAKNRAGAHVIVPLDKGASCPAELLVEAAHLAAHFSDARDERLVEVQYTPRRFLRKPRGSAPGLVVVDREKVLVLRREDAVLRGLLERERDDEEPRRR